MRFKEKVVWITGASSGIGEALAYAFYKEGAHLILSARRIDELKRVKKACLAGNGQIELIDFDINFIDKIYQIAGNAIKLFDKLDILVNNAGVAQRSTILDTNLEVYQQIMGVNFFGPITLTKAVLPSMINRDTGHIVFIGSPAGIFSTPLRSGYAASKHAIHSFAESLSTELADKKINVTKVIPGPIRTNMSISSLTGEGNKYGIMDKFMDTGISPSICAKRTLDGVYKKKDQILVVNSHIRWMFFLKRFFPGYFSKISQNMAPR